MFKELKRLGTKKSVILAGIVALGIIFVLLSEYIPTKKSAAQVFDESAYTLALESRLEDLIGRVDGVGEVKVMVTLAGSGQYRYETGQALSAMAGTDRAGSALSYDMGYNNKSEPVLSSFEAPEIKGVSVVCKGADDALLRQKVVGLIAGALNLSVNRIYVTE